MDTGIRKACVVVLAWSFDAVRSTACSSWGAISSTSHPLPVDWTVLGALPALPTLLPWPKVNVLRLAPPYFGLDSSLTALSRSFAAAADEGTNGGACMCSCELGDFCFVVASTLLLDTRTLAPRWLLPSI